MNIKIIEDFSHRYYAKIFTSGRYNEYSEYGSSMSNRPYYYYNNPSKQQVEIELPIRSFERLVQCDHIAELEDLTQRQEAAIRQRNPTVAAAYEQYKMLLALCR
jgi:hypothetical protein